LNNMAWTLCENLDQPAEALRRVDEAIQRVGRQPGLLDTRGVILTRLGKADDAVKDLEGAAAGPRPTASSYFHLARAYALAGQAGKARDALGRAEKAGLAPDKLEPRDRRDLDDLRKVAGPR
jgi:predicted Zn-dependent protease